MMEIISNNKKGFIFGKDGQDSEPSQEGGW